MSTARIQSLTGIISSVSAPVLKFESKVEYEKSTNPIVNKIHQITALLNAIRANDYENAAKALKNGADPNFINGSEGTLLHATVTSGNLDFVLLLIENGADPRIVNRNSQNVLDYLKSKIENPNPLIEYALSLRIEELNKVDEKAAEERAAARAAERKKAEEREEAYRSWVNSDY